MIKLNSKQRAYLRSLAHPIDPVVLIGKEGITDALIQSINNAFNRRELIKVKALESVEETSREVANLLLAKLEDVQLVQIIGRIVVLYHPLEKAKIILP